MVPKFLEEKFMLAVPGPIFCHSVQFSGLFEFFQSFLAILSLTSAVLWQLTGEGQPRSSLVVKIEK